MTMRYIMTRNDTFYKILFAIEIALLPLVLAANFLLPTWTVGLFVAGILVAKIWMELFKNKENHIHTIIGTIGDVLAISTLVIFFTVKGYIDSVSLCVFTVVFAVLAYAFKSLLFKSKMPEMVDAVDACITLFTYLLIASLIVVTFHLVGTTQLIVNIALFALMLTSIVSAAYKLYYIFKTYDVMSKIKNMFAKIGRRK